MTKTVHTIVCNNIHKQIRWGGWGASGRQGEEMRAQPGSSRPSPATSVQFDSGSGLGVCDV
jgi:hypothetical protein